MNRTVIVTMLALCSAASLEAQATMVLPDKPLPTEHARVQDAAYVLRDTLFAVTGAAARMNRDFRETSDASLLSRAREMSLACAAAERNIATPRAAVGDTPASTRLREREKQRLLGAYDELTAATRSCVSQFQTLAEPGKGEEIRGYGNRHASTVVREIRRYESALDGYFRAMNIPNRPRGARPNPLAG